MRDTHLIVHIQAAVLIQILQQIYHDGLECVLFFLQLTDDILEHLPRKLAAGDASCRCDLIFDVDNRSVHILGVPVRVQHQRFRELVGECGFA